MSLILYLFLPSVIFVIPLTAIPSNECDDCGFGFELIQAHLEILQSSYEKLANQYSAIVEQQESKIILNRHFYNTLTHQIEHKIIPIKDCSAASQSGLYKIVSDKHRYPPTVYCDMESYGGRWLVIQQRKDCSVAFDRDWKDYQKGFGTVGNSTEFWLGLDLIHEITSANDHELIIELKNETGYYGFARYSLFKIADENELYKLEELGEFSGTIVDKMEYHKGQYFSTPDRDNDKSNSHCAQWYTGGWWYKKCANSVLNSAFVKHDHSSRGIYWSNFTEAATFSRMMIRVKN